MAFALPNIPVCRLNCINNDSKAGIFRYTVNNMASDTLSPYAARPVATMVLAIQN